MRFASIGEKIGLLRGLLSQSNAHTGPFYVDVDVTNRCNLSCIGCPFHGPGVARYHSNNHTNDDLPVSLFESLCVELRAMGTNTIILQGEGEPLLHPNIFDLIRIAKSNGFHTTVLSNGTLLSEENTINLIQSRLDVRVIQDNHEKAYSLQTREWTKIKFRLKDPEKFGHQIYIEADHFWIPSDTLKDSHDNRELGIMIRDLSVE